jgi:hypothetical protein
MICVNELSTQMPFSCHFGTINIVISPYAPHIEELWGGQLSLGPEGDSIKSKGLSFHLFSKKNR